MSLLTLALASSAAATSYSCSLESPKAVNRSGSAVTIDQITFRDLTAEDWRFQLALDKGKGGKGIDVTIVWPGNPIQIAGKFAALATADGSVSFATFSAGPCMFTESMCMSLVNMAQQPDGSIKFVVLPSALASDKEANMRKPFIVVAEGSCVEHAA